jgi:hypothetical protein
VVRRRGSGEPICLEQWCALVEDLVTVTETPRLEAMVVTGVGRPGDDCFRSWFVQETVEVPVLDLGRDPSTLLTRRVTRLQPGGVADRAGLREASRAGAW